MKRLVAAVAAVAILTGCSAEAAPPAPATTTAIVTTTVMESAPATRTVKAATVTVTVTESLDIADIAMCVRIKDSIDTADPHGVFDGLIAGDEQLAVGFTLAAKEYRSADASEAAPAIDVALRGFNEYVEVLRDMPLDEVPEIADDLGKSYWDLKHACETLGTW